MKKKSTAAILFAVALATAGCADLGFGVDIDSGTPSPYWYGNGYLGGTYWNTPVWNYGPIYHQSPPPPPFINSTPGPAMPPQQNKPPGNNNQGNNQGSISPGGNRVPTEINGIQRPGNGGLPSGSQSNNSRR